MFTLPFYELCMDAGVCVESSNTYRDIHNSLKVIQDVIFFWLLTPGSEFIEALHCILLQLLSLHPASGLTGFSHILKFRIISTQLHMHLRVHAHASITLHGR